MEQPARHNLLTLPREIRNIIYGYLSRNVIHQYHQRSSPTPYIRFEHAPIVSVLLTNSQLRQEYTEVQSVPKMHATMSYIMSHGTPLHDALFWESNAATKRALSRVKCLTVDVGAFDDRSDRLWQDAGVLLENMMGHMPHLSMIEIIHSAQLTAFPYLRINELNDKAVSDVWDHLQGSNKGDKVVPPPPE